MERQDGTGAVRVYTAADRRAIDQDEVVRMHRLMSGHVDVDLNITTPKQNGTDEFIAIWKPAEGVITIHHPDLRVLCGVIEKKLREAG